jgi:hypothetical protein
MNIQNTNTNNFITENRNRIFFLFLLFVLSSMRMFGQTSETSIVIKQNEVNEVVECKQVETSVASLDTQMDFVGWFMGSRQFQVNENESKSKTANTSSTKKQILTSGITPNKVLYRTFMKRVISQDNAIV